MLADLDPSPFPARMENYARAPGWVRAAFRRSSFARAKSPSCAIAMPRSATDHDVAGFWLGLWQGFIAPFVFLASLFQSNLSIYEVHNNGAWYNFGYLFGLA
jgi:hypothetical protein